MPILFSLRAGIEGVTQSFLQGGSIKLIRVLQYNHLSSIHNEDTKPINYRMSVPKKLPRTGEHEFPALFTIENSSRHECTKTSSMNC